MVSNIEWTNITWNPVTGCTPISEGCQNCYAERMHKRLQAMGQEKYQLEFNQVQHCMWELTKKFGKKSKMIFVNSMSDLFHDNVMPPKTHFIFRVFENIEKNPQHVFQILTKRSHNLTILTKEYKTFKFPRNVWLGVTVELAEYKSRIDDLRQTNAKIKFLSCEPLLGDLGKLDLTGIDWVIVGGESGPGARPMHPDWVRNILRQCQEQNVKFFFKQWGEWLPRFEKGKYSDFSVKDMTGKNWDKLYRFLGFDGENICYMAKVGKKKAGRELDGQIWDQIPEVIK